MESNQAYSELREIPVSSESIFEGKILHVERWQVTCPNGNLATREIVVHKGAAAVVPVYEDGTTLLVRQHRVSVDRVTLEIPAGKLDSANEDPYDCAVRELEEETGLKAGRMTFLTSLLTTPGFCTEKIGIYLAQDLSQGQTHPDEDEFLGIVRMPLEEAIGMVMRGEIRDGKTVCGLLMAREVIRAQKEQA
ncbi:MAG: NUDIX hydrolase [Clostridia bacterium]|nr:NUDIX hydrolase [Clostridia bacterium]